MNKNVLFSLIFLLSSCSQVSPIRPKQVDSSYQRADVVSVGSTMHLAHNSYLKGCVDGVLSVMPDQSQKKGMTLSECREKAASFMDEILEIMEQEL